MCWKGLLLSLFFCVLFYMVYSFIRAKCKLLYHAKASLADVYESETDLLQTLNASFLSSCNSILAFFKLRNYNMSDITDN
jgi:hypothetical protein